MRGCQADCLHRAMVESYQLARAAEEERAENDKDFEATLTFKRYIQPGWGEPK